jgi:hypothetical protein
MTRTALKATLIRYAIFLSLIVFALMLAGMSDGAD